MKQRVIWQLLFLMLCFKATGAEKDDAVNKLAHYMQAINNFSKYVPQEKVYLHFDNTSYYQSDNIWFKCYVESSGLFDDTQLSKTLYVELLNPGGKVIDVQVLNIENGQCHGSFQLIMVPFYSGFYEVRAYTKYMLNFGEDAIFSRLLPVFDRPKTHGDFKEKSMLKYGRGEYQSVREKPQKGKKVNVKFFPEGGNLIRGVESKVAFEATDEFGSPIEIGGKVINEAKEEIADFSIIHEGRGVFNYTPDHGKHKAIVDFEGKNYNFDMPEPLSEGVVLTIDNLSYPDSIEIILQKNEFTPDCMVGMVAIARGKLQNYCVMDISGNESVSCKIDKTKFPSGVSQIILFDENGYIICERLIFTYRSSDVINIKSKTEKKVYAPFELVDMEFAVTDKNENPFSTGFSVSIRDEADEIERKHNMMTDVLLMSEIKGFIRNPLYYFESDDDIRVKELDLLMMVQGWSRHSWKYMSDKKITDLKFQPEQGIETTGQVVTFVKSKPKPGVDVSLLLTQKEEEEKEVNSIFESFITDSLGQFSFVSDVTGKWNMVLSVKEKGKAKDHKIILDRLFSPKPRRIEYKEMRADIVDNNDVDDENEFVSEITPDIGDSQIDSLLAAYEGVVVDGVFQGSRKLDEVTVTAKKKNKDSDARSKSIAYFDISEELDDIKDNNEYFNEHIHQLMMKLDKNFIEKRTPTGSTYLLYKNKLPLFVINYNQVLFHQYSNYKYVLSIESIKSIYINESFEVRKKYVDPRMTSNSLDQLGCIVFIETYPEGEVPAEAGKGVRKTKLEGYSLQKEFYNPDYSVMPSEQDYRRTLYWNPSVTTDKDGIAGIRFYNNSKCRKFVVSAETITTQGKVGIYRDN